MTLHGIDVSHWQSGLNLAKAKPGFAIMKATDGTSYVDAACDGFVSQAKNLGIPWGVYHFWQGNAKAEATHFVDSVRGYLGKGLLVLDFEGAQATSAAEAHDWLDRVTDLTDGIRPLIYMSQSLTQWSSWGSVASHYGLWVARYADSYGDTGAWEHPAMWQHTSSGHVAGYSGNVDLDTFYGDRAAWTAYATGGDDQQPAPEPKPDDDGKPPQLAVDGVWGSSTTKRIQQVLGTEYKDGKVSRQNADWKSQNPGLTSGWEWMNSGYSEGSQTIGAIQKKVGAKVDRLIGPDTIKKMQQHFGTYVDGHVDHPSNMVKAMQKRLNAGKF